MASQKSFRIVIQAIIILVKGYSKFMFCFIQSFIHSRHLYSASSRAGLLIAVAPRYRYCSGATFTVAVAPLLLAESSGDSSAATFLAAF